MGLPRCCSDGERYLKLFSAMRDHGVFFLLSLGSWVALALGGALALSGCTIKKKAEPDPMFQAAAGQKLSPEQSEEVLGQLGSNWLYGQGVGETAMNVGGVILFPPYAIYLIGNAALSLSGYEPLSVASALPEEEGESYREAYESIAAGPGRFAAAVAGREYRTKDVIKDDYRRILGANGQPSAQGAGGGEGEAAQ